MVLFAPRNFRKRSERTVKNEVWFGLVWKISVGSGNAHTLPFHSVAGNSNMRNFLKVVYFSIYANPLYFTSDLHQIRYTTHPTY